MNKIYLRINQPLPMIGGVIAPKGVCIAISVQQIILAEQEDRVIYMCEAYAHADKINEGESPILLKGIHDNLNGGQNAPGRRNEIQHQFGGVKSGKDFDLETVLSSEKRLVLSPASMTSLGNLIKSDICNTLKLEATAIELV